ncbi:hypothetical protein DMR_36060 [Solidesulfovibrio magneticus RS-1]|uniref:Uncharacterized protein n=1 Tax=Solidesulfovibrio magneticus (strain ATCC 700980 / DSM 13731 / RS-1) TaxID=573370 RepID=C4XLF8_SOLM1|nr:hypothetical protein DMR_36060 [Solidesulfovibrio magneticus RS-1]
MGPQLWATPSPDKMGPRGDHLPAFSKGGAPPRHGRGQQGKGEQHYSGKAARFGQPRPSSEMAHIRPREALREFLFAKRANAPSHGNAAERGVHAENGPGGGTSHVAPMIRRSLKTKQPLDRHERPEAVVVGRI